MLLINSSIFPDEMVKVCCSRCFSLRFRIDLWYCFLSVATMVQQSCCSSCRAMEAFENGSSFDRCCT